MNTVEWAAENGKRVHFIGIGGVMMNALALEMHRRGAVVTGTDRDESPNVAFLRERGISVHIGHDAEVIDGADIVVRNAAIKDSSPDIIRARELGLPILERPDVLGQIMSEYSRAIAVAGTHGKSTTSGMITHVLSREGLDPTAFIGAALPTIGGVYCLGRNDWFVAEACEYCESFLYLHPHTALILNVEEDHLDYYSGIGQIMDSFEKFALNTPENDGCVVVNAENLNAVSVAARLVGKRRVVTYGMGTGDYHAENLEYASGCGRYDLFFKDSFLCRIELTVPGSHNVSDSVAAAATLINDGVAPALVAEGLSCFPGMERRFQYLGQYNGARVYDDYAHHPDELIATINTAKTIGGKRVVCLFQPHTYSRTAALLDGFVEVLKAADMVVLADIFSARETDTLGVSSSHIAEKIPGALYIPRLSDCYEFFARELSEGDIFLACGAGNVNTVAHKLMGESSCM
ncbi:MAG: UDP-N-acetylmuramate--L-alanine ligase [Clostridia bacterium]|nr:UDP-N-acetylmuramate--L-alanine ligase [Clostridia bacterium]